MSSGGYFKVGLFVLVATAIGVIGIIAVGADKLSEDVVTFETYLSESVQGLDVGALVKARGVPMGRVTAIDFVANRYAEAGNEPIAMSGMVYVEFEMTKTVMPERLKGDVKAGLEMMIASGMRIRISSAGITGAMYMEIDIAKDPPPPLEIDWTPEHLYFPSVSSTMKQFVDKAEGALESIEEADLGAIGQKIQTILDDADAAITGDLARTLKNVAVASDELPELVRDLKKKVNDTLLTEVNGLVGDLRTTVKTDLKGTLNSIEEAGKKIPADFGAFLDSIDEGAVSQLGPLLENLEATTSKLPETVAGLNQTLRRIDRTIAGQQTNLDQAMTNIRRIAEDLQELIETTKREPSRILFGRPPAPAKSVRNR